MSIPGKPAKEPWSYIRDNGNASNTKFQETGAGPGDARSRFRFLAQAGKHRHHPCGAAGASGSAVIPIFSLSCAKDRHLRGQDPASGLGEPVTPSHVTDE